MKVCGVEIKIADLSAYRTAKLVALALETPDDS